MTPTTETLHGHALIERIRELEDEADGYVMTIVRLTKELERTNAKLRAADEYAEWQAIEEGLR